MKVVLKGSITEYMARQTFGAWALSIARAFNQAGAHAASAALAAAVLTDGMDLWERLYKMLEFALAAFVIKGATAALEQLAADPVPFDDDGKDDPKP